MCLVQPCTGGGLTGIDKTIAKYPNVWTMGICVSMIPIAMISFYIMKKWSDGRKREEQKVLVHQIRKLKRERTMLRSDIESNKIILQKLQFMKNEKTNSPLVT